MLRGGGVTGMCIERYVLIYKTIHDGKKFENLDSDLMRVKSRVTDRMNICMRAKVWRFG